MTNPQCPACGAELDDDDITYCKADQELDSHEDDR